jgi:AcrR family transcriptional regulator
MATRRFRAAVPCLTWPGRPIGRGLGYAANVGDRAVDGHEPAQAVRRSSDNRPGRRRLSVDERRDELISAALELFSDRPPEDISIDDVADAAGASRALVYHYFGGKQELYVAALHSAAKQLDDLLRPPAEGKPLERLAVSLNRYFDFVEDHAAGFVALLRGGPAYRSGDVGEVLDGIRGLVMNHITTSIGVEDPGPVLRITLRSWMASVETAGLDWLEHRDLPRAELESLMVDHHVVLLSVAARRDPEVAALLSRFANDDQ